MKHTDIEQRIGRAIADQVFPGCVFGMVLADGSRYVYAAGSYTYENDFAMFPGAMFDIASLTKVLPTAVAALTFIDRKQLSLDSPVREFVPELAHSRADAVTVRHLLTQTLDFDFQLSSLKTLEPRELLAQILKAELRTDPGQRVAYANATSILLGMVVEKVAGRPLDAVADELFFLRLAMKNTTFYPEKFRSRHIVPTEIDPWRNRVLVGEVHDESAWQLQKIMVPGSAGLFSTVPDLLVFMEMIVNKGLYRNRRYLSDEIVDQMATNQMFSAGESTGLGWELNQPQFMGNNSSQLIGKTGFTGCCMTLNIKDGIGYTLLANSTYPHRKPTRDRINEVRRDLADIVFTP